MRIHIFGASGSGTTTLGAALAQSLGCRHFDADDYFWVTTDPPYTTIREVGERQVMLQSDLDARDAWVLSGSLSGWGDFMIQQLDLAVFIRTDQTIRMERLKKREIERFGPEIEDPLHPQFATHTAFMEWAEAYDTGGSEMRSLATHEAWMKTLSCPILKIQNEIPVCQSLKTILDRVAER